MNHIIILLITAKQFNKAPTKKRTQVAGLKLPGSDHGNGDAGLLPGLTCGDNQVITRY